VATPAGEPKALLCPSAPPDWDGAELIGVAAGSVEAPVVRYTGRRPVTPQLLALAEPASPTEVFRFTAPCAERGCAQFDGTRCRLSAIVTDTLGEVAQALPRCGIRPRCRWWREAGAEACRRCPQVVTDNPAIGGAYAARLAEL
jgi:hypothetical protein